MSLNNVHFILARPQLGENIGATARVLKNFGFNKLCITSPRDGWPNQKAIATSVGASNIIESSFKALIDSLDYKLYKEKAPANN